jgi:hypothetical protein
MMKTVSIPALHTIVLQARRLVRHAGSNSCVWRGNSFWVEAAPTGMPWVWQDKLLHMYVCSNGVGSVISR